ncbi:unnamed protein product [Discosporangium mesarthrocarpum]
MSWTMKRDQKPAAVDIPRPSERCIPIAEVRTLDMNITIEPQGSSEVTQEEVNQLIVAVCKMEEDIKRAKAAALMGVTAQDSVAQRLTELRIGRIEMLKRRTSFFKLPSDSASTPSAERVALEVARLDSLATVVEADTEIVEAALLVVGLRASAGVDEIRSLFQEQHDQLGDIHSKIQAERSWWIGQREPSGEDDVLNHIRDSVYWWAVVKDPSMAPTDPLIAWVILLVQTSIYVLIILVGIQGGNSDAECEKSYITLHVLLALCSCGVTMLLVLSFSATDLVTIFYLFRYPGDLPFRRCAFAILLTVSLACLLAASVVVFRNLDGIELVLGAVAVLFIADVDEKAMTALSQMPPEWRLFSVLETIGLSLVGAVIYASFAETQTACTARGGCNSSITVGDNGRLDVYCFFYSPEFIPFHLGIMTGGSCLVTLILAQVARCHRTLGHCISEHQHRWACGLVFLWILVALIPLISQSSLSIAVFLGFQLVALIAGVSLHALALCKCWTGLCSYLPALLLGWGLSSVVSLGIHQNLIILDKEARVYLLSFFGFAACALSMYTYHKLGSFVWSLDDERGQKEWINTRRHWIRVYFWSVMGPTGWLAVFWADQLLWVLRVM